MSLTLAGDGTLTGVDATASGLLARANGIGLNVVSALLDTPFTQSSVAGGTFVPVTGLSVTITPNSTTSKILLIANLSGSTSTNVIFGSIGAALFRGTTKLAPANVGNQPGVNGAFLAKNDFGNGISTIAFHYLDSPGTDDPVTYSISAITNSDVSSTLYINRTNDDANSANHVRTSSSITAIEVAA
jgi:hypothetical protein